METDPTFGGRIGRTLADSEPWWPDPPDGTGGPNVVMIVLDDTGFAHFGCYGSTLETPNIDALAAGGLRYTGFHTTALCSPTRACLMTGRNHHTTGIRAISNWDSGFPNMRGGISPSTATIAELLRPHGYARLALGKWHLAPMHECSAAGPFESWPLSKGFDRYYGFLQGETDQFSPELTVDNHHVDPPGTAADGYHVSADLVDRAEEMIRDVVSIRPDQPFFTYLAFGAMHAPHQAPSEYLERWRGRFDEGYEVWRERWFARQVELGVVPDGTQLAPRNPGVPAWDDLTDSQQRFSCRLQEAYAAMLEHTDHQIGRLVEFLRSVDLLDDTLLMVLSDNGASQEGGPFGVMDEFSFFNGLPEDVDEIVANRLDDIGGPNSHTNYPWGWAQAGNSPLRWYKQNTYGGGVRDPLVVHWPARIGPEAAGGFRRQFCHAIDLAATVLDVTDAPVPDVFEGRAQVPLDGRSIAPTFDDPDAEEVRSVQYFEQMGHRGIYRDGWKATTYHRAGTDFDEEPWGLFHLDEDFSECADLAAEDPDRLAAMVELWWSEAEAHGVLPLDDRTIELFLMPARPGTPHDREAYEYLPPMSHVPSDASPRLGARSFAIVAEFTVGDRTPEGIIYSRGSHNLGHCFFVADGEVHFDYNALGHHTRVRAPVEFGPGTHTLTVRFDRSGDGGELTVAADGRDLASASVPQVIRILGSIGTDIGHGPLNPVLDELEGPFPFDATLHRVVFTAYDRERSEDVAAHSHSELARE